MGATVSRALNEFTRRGLLEMRGKQILVRWEFLRKVDDASRHLLHLVNDYLDLAKVMSGSLPVQNEDVVVATEVTSVVDLLRPTASPTASQQHNGEQE